MEKKFDILVVGELNIDLILNGIQKEPEIGKEILADTMTLTLGSSSAIFASNISTLGSKVAFAGKIGNDSFGNLVINSLKEKNINTENVFVSKDKVTGASIILNYDNDRAIITHLGAIACLSADDISDELLANAKHLHVSSIFLQENLKKGIIQLFGKAKSLGLTTSLDIQWDPAEKWDINFEELLPLTDIFLPNKQEITALTKEDDTEKALDKLGHVSNIIAVKLGTEGAIGMKKGIKIIVPPFLNEHVVDAIGAGDSFNAGFIYKYLKGEGLQECLEFGNLTGAVNTTASGGTAAFSNLRNVKQTAKEKFNVIL